VRIEDENGNGLRDVYIWLTKDEATEMEDALRQLLEDPSKDRHEHISARAWLETGDAQLYREITVSIDRG
jgi:hypothetical protein